jgi:hypothetical protein
VAELGRVVGVSEPDGTSVLTLARRSDALVTGFCVGWAPGVATGAATAACAVAGWAGGAATTAAPPGDAAGGDSAAPTPLPEEDVTTEAEGSEPPAPGSTGGPTSTVSLE